MSTQNPYPPDRYCTALIVAAGRGSRARRLDDQSPKQYAMIGGKTILAHTLNAFCAHEAVGAVQVVIHKDDRALYDHTLASLDPDHLERISPPVIGGATRQASVLQGLTALAEANPKQVLVHDAARPFVSPDTITRVVSCLRLNAGAVAAMPLTDTIKQVCDDGKVITVPRDQLWSAQTPQGFHYSPLRKAHRDAVAAGKTEFTDDAAVAEWAGLKPILVEGNAANTKITTAQDLLMAEIIARQQKPGQPAQSASTVTPDIRTGNGFDVHRLVAGTHVCLCGIKIAHDMAMQGHSDADVGLHALTDALLGAIGDGDIGAHFPPSDPQWKGASSDQFLSDAARRVRARDGAITNVDVTIMCETPKIGPHRDAMRAKIANILAIDTTRVSVKATTTEKLGFTGRGEGIAAMATATVIIA